MRPRISLDALVVLDAIERRGSFAAAAEELHRVPSAITYTVQKLEQDLGVVLFDRSGHRARLTEAGRVLVEQGRNLLWAAGGLERMVRQVATGWEAELAVAVSDLLPLERLFPLVEAFYAEHHGTRLRLLREVFGGVWDALASGRADLAIGASGEGPANGGYATRPLGHLPFVFVVPRGHPLAEAPEPVSDQVLLRHRAVAAADSSRRLPPRTAALLSGQDVLTLPEMRDKVAAHRHGLGVGHVPRYLVAADLAAGRLVEKRLAHASAPADLHLAWREDARGRALAWFVERLERDRPFADLLEP
ncbi:LysR family transcriptional regulator [Inmirania thermothiophila]|uniref:LysR family transcriptional regulator n=1 Tax=Inmirania thermothiophila TaxID=1750597 RepID=A0A3N1YAK1_9GAMM|nr:LysR family transcriptional regulator [Inmirania thermothiophila]ROR34417.1 LysR family transcriptional regulator [Inmirania thermothiophila]